MNAWVCILPSSLALQMANLGRGLRLKGGTSETPGDTNVGILGPLIVELRMWVLELGRLGMSRIGNNRGSG